MMESWLAWARGPVFIAAFSFMVLGLPRHVGITVWEVARAVHRAGDKNIPYRKLIAATIEWLIPMGKLWNQVLFSLTSFLFHVAILIVPIFLGGHIALWARGLGVSWPAVSNPAADVLTIVAIVTAVALVVQRIASRPTRALSRFQDYAIPLVVALPFASGFLLMHPSANPFSHDATFFVHVMSGNLLFVLIPITKLSHIVLLPGVQIVSEVAWHWPPDAGSKVAVALGKESEPI
jgi:nitrate reductase gamma subunit